MNGVLAIAAIVMLVLLFLKVPVYISVLGGAMVYFVMNPDVNSIVFAQQAITGTESISLLAIPFFVCAGVMMNYTGVTKRIMDFCEVITGRMYGGLAQVNVLLSTLMAAFPAPTSRTPRWKPRCWCRKWSRRASRLNSPRSSLRFPQ